MSVRALIKNEWGIIKTQAQHSVSGSSGLEKKPLIIFLSVAVFQTIGWYYTSRIFFKQNFSPLFGYDPNLPLYEFLFWFIADFTAFMILPLLVIRFILKEPLRSFGIQIGDMKAGLGYSLLFIGVMLPIVFILSASPAFSDVYPHLKMAKMSWHIFFIYEAGMLLYMISWEFMWRGYMLFGLYEKFGWYAVLIQMIPFVILHNGKPAAETFGAIIGGIALGVLALRTHSFWYGVIIHFTVIFSIDLFSTLRYRL